MEGGRHKGLLDTANGHKAEASCIAQDKGVGTEGSRDLGAEDTHKDWVVEFRKDWVGVGRKGSVVGLRMDWAERHRRNFARWLGPVEVGLEGKKVGQGCR